MICEPCQAAGHQAGDCEDSGRDAAVYRSCSCQHKPIHGTTPAALTPRRRQRDG